MAEWEAVLFAVERTMLAPGIDSFLTTVVGYDWIDLLADLDRKAAERRLATRPSNNSRQYNRRDVQDGLRLLTHDRLPASARNALRKALPSKAQGLAFELRAYRNDLHHNNELPLEEIYRALDTSERLLLAMNQDGFALKVKAHRLALIQEFLDTKTSKNEAAEEHTQTPPAQPGIQLRETSTEPEHQGRSRIHELAKSFGVTSKVLLDQFAIEGMFVKSATSTVSAADARHIAARYYPDKPVQ
ncbi:translation initiation factor IF-2 N-terminal domain-containing protein [Williamsia sterculiae]|uniref:translation initiation factor IF-2 N-terminal domain-containing protein n=1 Tax=Williamsia sterculiae TaxID=1344003 RepID=UPI00135631CA|nr:translation initiation factor IF-2 N-terminal domain-containing protein [Williamsia sterculiae]